MRQVNHLLQESDIMIITECLDGGKSALSAVAYVLRCWDKACSILIAMMPVTNSILEVTMLVRRVWSKVWSVLDRSVLRDEARILIYPS